MITIEINNSYSKIIGLKSNDFNNLRKVLSYQSNPNAAYYGSRFARSTHLMDARGCFPTGLVALAEHWAQKACIPFTVSDLRVQPVPLPGIFKLNLGTVTPYPDQVIMAERAYQCKRGGLVAPTGFGKSLVIALVANRLQVRTLVIVPSVGIRDQLRGELERYLGKTPNIQVYNIDSSDLKNKTDFDCLIIDECHHVAAKTYRVLNKTAWANTFYRFFLTATFFRNAENEHLLFEGIAGQVIHQVSYKTAVAKGYICPVEAYYYDLPKKPSDLYSWAEVYKTLVVENEYRNNAIRGLLMGLSSQGLSTLCLVKEIAHGAILERLTGIPFANGQDETTRHYIQKFKDGKIKALIGTTGILGEGVDTKPAEYIIIAGLGKAKSAFMQAVGRAIRVYPGKESAKVVLFRDTSHRFCLRHYNEQRKILKEEYGVIPIKLEIE